MVICKQHGLISLSYGVRDVGVRGIGATTSLRWHKRTFPEWPALPDLPNGKLPIPLRKQL